MSAAHENIANVLLDCFDELGWSIKGGDVEMIVRRLTASGMSAFGQDRETGLEAKPASPVGATSAETPKGGRP